MPRKPQVETPEADSFDTAQSIMVEPELAADVGESVLSQTGAEESDPPSSGHDPELPDSQTETEPSEFPVETPGLQAGAPADVPDSQTELDQSTDEPVSDAPASQTGPEIDTDPQRAEEAPDRIPDSQTGSEETPQNDLDPEPRAKNTRKRASQSQSGENPNVAPKPAPGQAAQTAPTRRRRARTEPILSIDDERSVETREDKLRSDLLDLVESQKGRKILTGAIQGVESSADNPNLSFAVIYHGEFKVIIPAEETVRPPADLRGRSPQEVMHYLVTKRLGAEVDYIVKGVDINSGIAAASRLEAMALKRRQYYFGTDRDGNNLIYEGLSAEARVVSVIRAGIFVDLFGLETYIPLRELSYQRWLDAASHYQPGQRVLVKILKLDRPDRENIRVSASVKQAGENPYDQALKKYVPGSRYVGTVSMVDTNGVFVSLDGGVDCLCSYPKRGRPPRGSRVTVRIIGVNHETNRIWGAITHMTTAR